MNHKLGRLLRPGMGAYFTVMALFCAATLLAGTYWLAAGECVATLTVFAAFTISRNNRDRRLRKYIQSASNTLESMGKGESPFPAFLVRLADGGIIWTNHRFSELTGVSDTMVETQLEEMRSAWQEEKEDLPFVMPTEE